MIHIKLIISIPHYGEPSLKPGSVDNSNYKFILNSKFDDTTTNQLSFINLDYDTNFNAYLTKVRTMRISDQFTKILMINISFPQDLNIVMIK